MKNTAVTLLEILIVMVIIGVMASIAVNYRPVIEKSLNKEAKVNLKLIAAGERIYRIENNEYYYSANSTELNNLLRIDLPSGGNSNWNYTVTNTTVDPAFPTFNITATRRGYGDRVFSLTENQTDPLCDGANYCE